METWQLHVSLSSVDVGWWGSGAHPLGGMEWGVPVAGPYLRPPWDWPLTQAVSI